MKNTLNFKIAIITALILILVGIIYSFTVERVYQADAQALLMRPKIDSQELGTEESKNRWIWIRDGLSLKGLIVSEIDLKIFIETNPQYKNFQNENFTNLKKMIEIQYTGADDNNYIITVKGTNKDFVINLTKHLFERLKVLATDKTQEDYASIIEKLKRDSSQYPNNSIELGNYQSQIRKIALAQTIDQAQKQAAFQIIQLPTLKADPIWPRPKLIILVLSILGFITGIIIEMGISYYNSEN